MSDAETTPVEPTIPGFVDAQAARLTEERERLLVEIATQKMISQVAMGTVKEARAELKRVERMLRSTMPKGAKL